MDFEKLEKILGSMNLRVNNAAIAPFVREEDGEEYSVWKITADSCIYVLKKAKEYETEVYSGFFNYAISGVPRLMGACSEDGEEYILIEYIDGNDMRKCDRTSLIKVLDTLIGIQQKYWEQREKAAVGYNFEKSLESRINRGKYLGDAELERAYAEFLLEYQALPRTLCHDDLLPFNVIINEKGAFIIDWEYAGILPYPASFVRLIAHGEEDENAFFHMKDEDRLFAIDYYYENLIRAKGISYADYRRSIDLFLLYEYCEWIMLGNKYTDADMERYEKYLKRAKAHLKEIFYGFAIDK